MAVAHSIWREAGRVTINSSTCTQCGECARICPTGVLRMSEGRVDVVSDSMFGCIACGHCMMVCPKESVSVAGRGLSLTDVVSLPPAEDKTDAESLLALMRSRRSVRRFKKEEPAPELIEQILSMAASGPMGIPPWDVGCVVVRRREKVQALANEVIDQYQGLLKILKPWLLPVMRLVMKRPAYEQMSSFILPLAKAYVEGRERGRDLLFHDAPVVLLFHHSPYVDASEAMIACTYAMLAAESLGLGTTMIGAAAPVIMRNSKLCRGLGIPERNKPAIALIIGYPAVHFRRGVIRRFSSVSRLD